MAPRRRAQRSTLYTEVAVLAVGVEVAIAETLLSSAFTWSAAAILAIASGFAFITWLLYKVMPHLDSFVDRIGGKPPSNPPHRALRARG